MLCSICYLLRSILTILSNLYFRLFSRRISLRRAVVPFNLKLIWLLLFDGSKLSLTWNFWKLLLWFSMIWGSNVLILIILIYTIRCWWLMLILMRNATDWIIVLMFNQAVLTSQIRKFNVLILQLLNAVLLNISIYRVSQVSRYLLWLLHHQRLSSIFNAST